MPTSFLHSSITPLNPGYRTTIAIPAVAIAARLVVPDARVNVTCQLVHEGETIRSDTARIAFDGGKADDGAFVEFVYDDPLSTGWEQTGFIDLSFVAEDNHPVFDQKSAIVFYSLFSASGRKSFFSDNAYKFGAPTVIHQVRDFGRFVEGFPTVHLDRDRDLAETITLINPYSGPIVVSIHSHDGRKLPRTRIPPQSVRQVRLIDLIAPHERDWVGHVQITASNRVILFQVKHSLADPTIISDHEHTDPYRSDPTHVPLTQRLRAELGMFLRNAWNRMAH